MNEIKQKPPKIFQLKISLPYIEPEIWRSFQVHSDVTLGELHDIIQIVMGWENCHMYSFDKKGGKNLNPYSIYYDDERDVSEITLEEILFRAGSNCTYIYDLGDCWYHKIVVEKTFAPISNERYPLCIDGARACPFEECGGAWGYENIVRILADPNDEEYEEMEYIFGADFDPEKFDCDEVNRRLQSMVDYWSDFV